MATRARRSAPHNPRRILSILLLLVVGLYLGIAATTVWAHPAGKTVPLLGLDLEGGRQITLKPIVGKNQPINAGQINQAVDIIRNRVNGNGVSEAQVATLGKNIVVSLPGEPSQATLDALAQSSQLAFRAVIQAQNIPVAAPASSPTPSKTPSKTPSATPSGSPSSRPAAKSSTASPSAATSTAKSTKGANDVLPQGYLADTKSPSSTASPSTKPSAPASTPAATPSATPTPSAPVRQLPGARPEPTDPSDPAWGNMPVDNIWVDNGMATAGETYSQLFAAFPCTNAQRAPGSPAVERWREVAAQAPADQADIGCDKVQKYLMGPVEVSGKELTGASWGTGSNQQGQSTGKMVVNLTFNGTGTKAFAAVTERLMQYQGTDRNRFAITVDGSVISAPTTNSPIPNGKAQIEGSFTESEAKTLANQLKFGALPFSFQELTSDQVSPQVGSDQLQKGILAGLAGLLLVVVYSLLQYRALGFVTVASLVVAGIIDYGLVVLLGTTAGFRLTMAGVTGLIVSIGITADSFIVYFERVRDEVRSGRPLRAAVETGWARARRTIIISDAVNFLASAVLYVLSEDTVKSFAFTLGMSTVVDIVIVMMFTHPVLTMLAGTKFFGGGHKWSGFDPDRLGARGVTYAGRGRVTIADRKAAAASTAAVEGGEA